MLRKEQGVPNLSSSQDKRYFNIICIENRIEGLNVARTVFKDSEHSHRFDLEFWKLDKIMAELTGRLTPEQLMKEMLWMSRED